MVLAGCAPSQPQPPPAGATSAAPATGAAAPGMPHPPWAPVLYITAKSGKGVSRILPLVEEVFHDRFDEGVARELGPADAVIPGISSCTE